MGRAGRAARAPGAGRGAGGERCPRRGRTHPPGHRKRASPCGLASTSVRREARREARSAAARAGNSWPRTPRIETPVIAQGRWHLHRRRGNKPGCSSGDRGRGECEQARAMQTAPCAHVSFAQRRVKNKAQTQQLESLHADRLVDGVIVALCLPVRAQRLRMDTARCASVCVCVCVCVCARARVYCALNRSMGTSSCACMGTPARGTTFCHALTAHCGETRSLHAQEQL